jgi:cell division protein FtsI/penicillin-binding protein 2
MNRAIRNVSVFVFLLIVILLVNLTYIQGFKEDDYANNSRDARQYFETKSVPRGQITAGGQVLAQSTADEDGLYSRQYPMDPVAYGSVLGYLSDRYGASGLEQSQNSILDGTDDSLFSHQVWDTLTGKEKRGANIDLTLEPNVQQVAYEQLANAGYSGSVVALRPSTGEVLAMASTPSYNPADLVSTDPSAEENAFTALQNDDSAPLLDRSTQQIQPPGSTFKLITTATALQAGDTADTLVNGDSQITLPDGTTTLENYGGETCGGGPVPLRTAFAKSCNTSFVDLSQRHGIDPFQGDGEGIRHRRGDGQSRPAGADLHGRPHRGQLGPGTVRHRSARRGPHPAAERGHRRDDRQRGRPDGAPPHQAGNGSGPETAVYNEAEGGEPRHPEGDGGPADRSHARVGAVLRRHRRHRVEDGHRRAR